MNLDRTWGEVCSHAYREYMDMKCYLAERPTLFGSETMEIETTINTMLTIVRQEVRKFKFIFLQIAKI